MILTKRSKISNLTESKEIPQTNNPVNESVMSNLDYEIRYELPQLQKDLLEVKEHISYLKNYARKEVGRGGNYDSHAELDSDIKSLESDVIDLEKAIQEILDKIKLIKS